jgi:hypothetical protein
MNLDRHTRLDQELREYCVTAQDGDMQQAAAMVDCGLSVVLGALRYHNAYGDWDWLARIARNEPAAFEAALTRLAEELAPWM